MTHSNTALLDELIRHGSIAQMAAALRAKKISCEALTAAYLQRIEQYAHLNALITIDRDGALKTAQAIDAAGWQTSDSPLRGIPMIAKDVFNATGLPMTCASKILQGFVSPYDAHVIATSKQAGMVLLGKANMDEFAMGSTTENSAYGATLNPWSAHHVPGGSSGGSAVAVAARLAPLALGSDTGGSVRQPAAFCGAAGLKPTYGMVSRYGMVAYGSSLDQAGPMAVHVADLAAWLDVLATPDNQDSTCLPTQRPNYLQQATTPPAQGLRIGVPKQFFEQGLDPQIAESIEQALRWYETELGAKRVSVDLPNLDMAIPCYYVIATAEASSNLSRFDGVRYGRRSAQAADLQQLYLNSRSEGFGEEVQRRILMGAFVLSHGYFDAYYLQAQKIRRLLTESFVQAFTTCDVLISPVAPTLAFQKGSMTTDPVQMYLSDIYTVTANLTGLPALALPGGVSAATASSPALPIGYQLLAPHGSDGLLLQLGHSYQQGTQWHLAMPPLPT